MVPAGSRVLEFGAGMLKLPQYLPSGCAYTPSDLVARSPDTIVCDLNQPCLPKFAEFDVMIFSGVLEYIVDCRAVIAHLRRSCREIIASYAVLRDDSAETLEVRRKYGWFSDHTESQFIGIFRDCGFEPVESREWDGQLIVRFARMPGEKAPAPNSSADPSHPHP